MLLLKSMEYTRIQGHIDISIVKSKSESATFEGMRPDSVFPSFNKRFTRVSVIPINDANCCGAPSLTRLKSFFQFFRMHLYNNHKLAIGIGVVAILLGAFGLVFSFGISSVVSWCLITGGVAMIGVPIYHSASVTANCGPCRPKHPLEYDRSDSERSEELYIS